MIMLIIIILFIVGYEFYKRMSNSYDGTDDKSEGFVSSCCPG